MPPDHVHRTLGAKNLHAFYLKAFFLPWWDFQEGAHADPDRCSGALEIEIIME